MLKLSLWERLKFWRREGVFLKEYGSREFEKYGLKQYEGEKRDQYFLAEMKDGEKNIVLISTGRWGYETLDVGETKYFFSDEGVFFKRRNEPLTRIYSSDKVTKMVVDREKNMFLLCKEQKEMDQLIKLKEDGTEILLEAETLGSLGNEYLGITTYGISGIKIENAEDDCRYVYVNQNNLEEEEKVRFTKISLEKAWEGQLVVANSLQDGKTVLVSIEEHRRVVEHKHIKGVNDVMRFADDYYFVITDESETNMYLLRHDEQGVKKLAAVPKGKYTRLEEIQKVCFYTMKRDTGMYLLTICEDVANCNFYENATEIKLSKPIIMEDGILLSIRPIVVYEEMK